MSEQVNTAAVISPMNNTTGDPTVEDKAPIVVEENKVEEAQPDMATLTQQ